MEHGLWCFAELTRLLLGEDAISAVKLACGASLTILGVFIELSPRGYRCTPSADKAERWCGDMRRALEEGRLLPGCASKLAGRLSWGGTHMFHRFGCCAFVYGQCFSAFVPACVQACAGDAKTHLRSEDEA